MSEMWVKICGITRAEDAEQLVDAGVDAMGLVFVPQSSRALSMDAAKQLAELVGSDIQRIGLFMDASPEFIKEVLDQVPLDALQFHGQETPAECEQFERPYLKALGLADAIRDEDWLKRASGYQNATALLIDSHASGQMGGTGQSGDWDRLKRLTASLDKPWIMAGGLGPHNVHQAILACSPDGVDLSSGVESQPGHKDHGKIEALMSAIGAVSIQPKNGVHFDG